MAHERKPNTAALFKEEDKQNPKGPDYTGMGLIEGKELRLAAWINEAQTTGKKYLSITFEEPRKKEAPTSKQTNEEDDVPF